MNRLRALTPVQVILAAVIVLVVGSLAGYFVVTRLTTAKAGEPAVSTIPENLNDDTNQKVLQALEKFEAPLNLPLPTEPLRTPDPESPSTINPFTR